MEVDLSQRQDFSTGTHVVKFFADWCGPCKFYAPAFERVASKTREASFHSINIEEEPILKEDFGITSVPTTVVLRDGEELGRLSGAKSTAILDTFLKGMLNS